MKRLIFLFTTISLFLCGCTHEIPLQQPAVNITKIILVDEIEGGACCTLSGSDATQFMNDLAKLECRKNLQPQEECGYLQIQIHYENGDIDIIGCKGNARITDGDFVIDGWFDFSEEDLLKLFSSYTEPILQ